MYSNHRVLCRVAPLSIPTYPEPDKERLPMYCENRIHQRTSGRVYPCAVVKEVVRDRKIDREYTAIMLENDFIELVILPELGGRIFSARDKSNGYDFFYRQHVIKPALIGLLGSWISGGAEFNWPLHHRPSTFAPTDYEIEEESDGSVTVWLSEHEPLDRMKGMVGIRLTPGQAMFETRVKLYNRTSAPNSFLWWENIAVPVNQNYQIFFPGDVNHVHFHYKKSVTAFPVADSMFNGIDYRDATRDIRWHKNTVNATSYFSTRSNYDFFGGFDHGKNAGVVHVANHHLSPGKKMFTWAYGQLSHSWETALTDQDGAYAELMAGVYTDNQPDFTWIEPYEMKEFSQFWYPIREIGAPKLANTRVALNWIWEEDSLTVLLYAVESWENASLEIRLKGSVYQSQVNSAVAGSIQRITFDIPGGQEDPSFRVQLMDAGHREIISYQQPVPLTLSLPKPQPPVPKPNELRDTESLFLAGQHLSQYRDPLTHPDVYWRRAVELDPKHSASLVALGRSALREGRLSDALRWLRQAVEAQTRFNPNPRDGEAYYQLGLALDHSGQREAAYDAFYKAVWSQSWRSAGYFALARINCAGGDWTQAREHLELALQSNARHLDARNLLSAVERLSGNQLKAVTLARETLRIDRVNYGARVELALAGELDWDGWFDSLVCDPSQTCLDLLAEKWGAGLDADAVILIEKFLSWREPSQVSPMIHYFLGAVLERMKEKAQAARAYQAAQEANPDYCFPSRLEEMEVLQSRLAGQSEARAAYLLGNLLYGKLQHDEALRWWISAQKWGETYYVLYRNLSVATYNQSCDGHEALHWMDEACQRQPNELQLVLERNLLLQRTNCSPSVRRSWLEKHGNLVDRNEELYMEWVRAYLQDAEYEKAIKLLSTRNFTPCEGGEHALVELWIVAHIALGRRAFGASDWKVALARFQQAQILPKNLGAGVWNSNIHLPSLMDEAGVWEVMGEREKAKVIYRSIVRLGRDEFTTMYQPAFDYYLALAHRRLGEAMEAQQILERCLEEWRVAAQLMDFGHFQATPFFLSFLERPEGARAQYYHYLLGLVEQGLGRFQSGVYHFERVLNLNSGHLWAQLELALRSPQMRLTAVNC